MDQEKEETNLNGVKSPMKKSPGHNQIEQLRIFEKKVKKAMHVNLDEEKRNIH